MRKEAPNITMGNDINFSDIAIFIFINNHMRITFWSENHTIVTVNGNLEKLRNFSD